MKKTLITTALALPLVLAACSGVAEEPVTVTESVTEDATDEGSEEPTDEDPVEPSETEDVTISPAAPDEPITITSSSISTTFTYSPNFDVEITLAPLASGEGLEPVVIQAYDPHGEPNAMAYIEALQEQVTNPECDPHDMNETDWADGESACPAVTTLAHRLNDLAQSVPGAAPYSATLTYTPDTPDGPGDPTVFNGTEVTSSTVNYRLQGEDEARYLLAVARLLSSEPSGEVCDTAAGATIHIDTPGGATFDGEFGQCVLEVDDYRAFNDISSLINRN